MVPDAANIIGFGLPCFCRGITPNSAFPSGPGEVGLPIALGEVMVDAGDLVLGGRDGVVVARSEISEAELHAKVAAGEIRSLLDRAPELRDQITCFD